MAGALQIELVAADRVVWSGEASEVIARTSEGDLGVLVDHAPLLSLLVPGVVMIKPLDGAIVQAAVGDGFLSVADNHVSILSEDTWLLEEIDEAQVRHELSEAEANNDDEARHRAEVKLRLLGKAA